MSVRFRAVRIGVVLAALLAALFPAGVEAASVTVRIGSALSPATVRVAPGTTVRWVNESDERHRMRSRNGPAEFDSGNLEPGEAFTVRLSREGTYPYLDDRNRGDARFHGTVVVGRSSGESATSGGGGGGAAPATSTVRMAGRSFSPAAVTIAAGGRVSFANDDDRAHTATGSGFDTGVLEAGARSTQTFPTAGTFSFLCSIHPGMRGTVTVRGASMAAPSPVQPSPSPTPTPSSPRAATPGGASTAS